MLTDGQEHTSAMVDAVRAMVRQQQESERHADEERDKLRSGVDATIAALRKDMHAVIASIQLELAQHRDEHTAERIDRSNSQLAWHMWMGGLTMLGIINLSFAIYLAFQSVH